MFTGSLIVWIAFVALILGLLMLDLGVLHRKSHVIGMREALLWSGFWIALGLLFTIPVYLLYQNHGFGFGDHAGDYWPHNGMAAAKMYLGGYLMEKSLSVDNIFVIALIFAYFGVPAIYQHRVLFWGIVGALVMRGAMIAAGTTLIGHFHYATILFGVILIATAIKMLFTDEGEVHPDRNPLVRAARRVYPVTPGFEGSKFFTRIDGRRAITPMFLVLLVIESMDLLFALDSIPAVIGITHDPFIVFTSNVFAILGLRALYFAVAGLIGMFKYLKVSLVVLLVFIGVKMLIAPWVHIDVDVSLWVIAGVLGIGVAASLISTRAQDLLASAAYMEQPISVGKAAWRQVRRLVILVIGSTVVLFGMIMFVTPGPGIAGVLLGLVILSTEFVWAKRLLNQMKKHIRGAARKLVSNDSESPNCDHCGHTLAEAADNRCPGCGQSIEPMQPEQADPQIPDTPNR